MRLLEEQYGKVAASTARITVRDPLELMPLYPVYMLPASELGYQLFMREVRPTPSIVPVMWMRMWMRMRVAWRDWCLSGLDVIRDILAAHTRYTHTRTHTRTRTP